MAYEMEKSEWTNFDLLNAVKRVSSQNNLSYNKSSNFVAKEIMQELGLLSINSSQSDQDLLDIKAFQSKYF